MGPTPRSIASVAGPCTSVAVSAALVLCHAGFLVAQLAGLRQHSAYTHLSRAEGLFEALLQANASVSTYGMVGLAAGLYEMISCDADPSCALDDASACAVLLCDSIATSKSVLQMSYVFSVRDLWYSPCGVPESRHTAEDWACTGPPTGVPVAIFLFLSSFVWPHIKLLGLHLCFYMVLNSAWRRNCLYWLACFGKWSFSDVLAMCVLIGLINLQLDSVLLDGDALGPFLPFPVATSSIMVQASAALNVRVVEVGVHAASQLQRPFVIGMLAMYAFCFSVVLSLLNGIIVEHYDQRCRWLAQLQARLPEAGASNVVQSRWDGWWRLHAALVAATGICHVAAFSIPILRRETSGSLSNLLSSHNIRFERSFSLYDMGVMSGAAGGWDYLMAVTYWIFLLVGPLLRVCTQLVLLLVPLPHGTALELHLWSRHVSSFYAMEVMAVAVPLINFTFGSLSAYMLDYHTFPPCTSLNDLYGDGAVRSDGKPLCLMVAAYPTPGYLLLLAAVALYYLSSLDGSITHKYMHSQLVPNDDPPPTCTTPHPNGGMLL